MWADLRAAAERVGAGAAFPDESRAPCSTTTRRSSARGVPSIDLIDFTFHCWHETCDDLTAVSKASLDKSGEAVLEFLRTDR